AAHSATYGGGIENQGILSVQNSTLAANSARFGGAIEESNGSLTVQNSTLSMNSASAWGGGIVGGGTFNNCTFSANSAGSGGGIYGGGKVLNSTFSDNTAVEDGGGIASFGTLTVRDSTILGNSAPVGGDVYNLGDLFIYDSVIGDLYHA